MHLLQNCIQQQNYQQSPLSISRMHNPEICQLQAIKQLNHTAQQQSHNDINIQQMSDDQAGQQAQGDQMSDAKARNLQMGRPICLQRYEQDQQHGSNHPRGVQYQVKFNKLHKRVIYSSLDNKRNTIIEANNKQLQRQLYEPNPLKKQLKKMILTIQDFIQLSNKNAQKIINLIGNSKNEKPNEHSVKIQKEIKKQLQKAIKANEKVKSKSAQLYLKYNLIICQLKLREGQHSDQRSKIMIESLITQLYQYPLQQPFSCAQNHDLIQLNTGMVSYLVTISAVRASLLYQLINLLNLHNRLQNKLQVVSYLRLCFQQYILCILCICTVQFYDIVQILMKDKKYLKTGLQNIPYSGTQPVRNLLNAKHDNKQHLNKMDSKIKGIYSLSNQVFQLEKDANLYKKLEPNRSQLVNKRSNILKQQFSQIKQINIRLSTWIKKYTIFVFLDMVKSTDKQEQIFHNKIERKQVEINQITQLKHIQFQFFQHSQSNCIQQFKKQHYIEIFYSKLLIILFQTVIQCQKIGQEERNKRIEAQEYNNIIQYLTARCLYLSISHSSCPSICLQIKDKYEQKFNNKDKEAMMQILQQNSEHQQQQIQQQNVKQKIKAHKMSHILTSNRNQNQSGKTDRHKNNWKRLFNSLQQNYKIATPEQQGENLKTIIRKRYRNSGQQVVNKIKLVYGQSANSLKGYNNNQKQKQSKSPIKIIKYNFFKATEKINSGQSQSCQKYDSSQNFARYYGRDKEKKRVLNSRQGRIISTSLQNRKRQPQLSDKQEQSQTNNYVLSRANQTSGLSQQLLSQNVNNAPHYNQKQQRKSRFRHT